MRRAIRLTLTLVCGATALLAIFHLEENWRGKRAWESWKAQRLAMGDRYDWSELAPPPVPDADNFAKEPLIEAAVLGKSSLLGDFRWSAKAPQFANWRLGQKEDVAAWASSFGVSDLRSALKPIDGRLDELVRATQRPACRMPFRYQYPEISEDPVPGLLGFRAAARMLRLRALARLHSGDSAGALEDTLGGLRLARQFQREPDLLSSLLASAVSTFAMQPVWEGVSSHAWSEPQLAELQAELGRLDLIASFRRAVQSERVFMAQAVEAEARESAWKRAKDQAFIPDDSGAIQVDRLTAIRLWLFIPEGWSYQSLRQADGFYAEGFLPALDEKAHAIHLRALQSAETRNPSFYNRLRGVKAALFASQAIRVASHQNALDEARIACALERHRLAQGDYPTALHDLVPAYLEQVPVDVVEGGTLRYSLPSPTRFLLYSIGSDGKDDGGKAATTPEGRYDLERGDWAWPQ